MCGIAGFIDMERSRDSAEILIDDMCQVIRHRGPDGQGAWVGDGMALGSRRLAIIDVAGGQQPIFNEDGSVVIVFNGEIYNYLELREALLRCGHRFSTNSDTEAIVHAYEEYGDACVTRLRGMFTFALWDRKRRRLLAARDRFGKKPLNYYWDGRKLIFGSEIKSILQAGIPKELNPEAIDEYLVYSYIPSPFTAFRGVQKLPAAHLLIYENGGIRTQRYWDLSFAPTCDDDEHTVTERLSALLRDAVAVRLMSEVPLGAFLSGGIDSSVVVGLMSELMSQPVKTFSIGFDEDEYSELPYARQIAQRFSTDHHEFVVRPELVTVLPQLAWAYDEPFGDPSMLPTYYVSKLAREHVTVALSGDGGDEIFGGYSRYGREIAVSHIPFPLRLLAERAAKLMPTGMRGKNRLTAMGPDIATRYVETGMVFPVGARSRMYRPDFLAQVGYSDPRMRQMTLFHAVERLDISAQMQFVDVHMYLPDDILIKVDKASMLNSLETRAPMLDQYLAEYVSSLPPATRMPQGRLKHLLKNVASQILPSDIMARRKQGFGVPLDRWFSRELTAFACEVLDSPRAHQRAIFRPEFVRGLLRQQTNTHPSMHGRAIWALLCLELWFQAYIDTPSSNQEPPSPVQRVIHATNISR